MDEKYDSTEDTKKHIRRVREFLSLCVASLNYKALNHDHVEAPPAKTRGF